MPRSARKASLLPRLVVLADSLAFHGPEGPVPLADPRLYPNQAGAALEAATGAAWDVQVWARAGYGLRETWLGLQKDVHLQQQLVIGADAVVLGTGTMDQASVAVPRWVVLSLAYLRPPRLRRRVRNAIDRWHPAATRLTRGRWRYTPPSVVAHGFAKSVDALRLFAPQAALVCVLPAVHRAAYYGGVDRWHEVTHRTRARAGAGQGRPCRRPAPRCPRRTWTATTPTARTGAGSCTPRSAPRWPRRLLPQLRYGDDNNTPGELGAAGLRGWPRRRQRHRPAEPELGNASGGTVTRPWTADDRSSSSPGAIPRRCRRPSGTPTR